MLKLFIFRFKWKKKKKVPDFQCAPILLDPTDSAISYKGSVFSKDVLCVDFYHTSLSSPSRNTSEVDLPLPDGGVETLPVAALDGVVVVQVLLLVLLHGGGRRRLLSGKDLRCHLLLLLGFQGDDLIAHRRQLGRAAGTPLFGAFTGLALN